MPASLDAYARAAAEAARAAGSLLLRSLGAPKTVRTKRSASDLVTELDQASEQLIYTKLHRAFPALGFLGEERGPRHTGHSSRWIVDPLDGTNNFVHGLPWFGVSIGLETNGRMVVGVIYDPVRRELFVAMKRRGAFLNGTRIHVSLTRRLATSLLATGFSSRFLTRRQPYLRWFETFQGRSHGVRRIGSTVLCLAAVAAGRLDGFYERDLWPWDLAAGALLVEEAGGRVSNLRGEPIDLRKGQLVASNGHIHREMLRVVYPAGRVT